MTKHIAPCLWFPGNAEEAANYYVSIFDDGKVLHVDRFNENGPAPDAPVVFVEFRINGQDFQAINGGNEFPFSEAISFSISCRDQAEVDRYWDRFIADGGEESQCGWLKDKFGVSWQIVPARLMEMHRSSDRERAGKAMRKMLTMRKLNVAELEAAYNS
jgi:predicted 3-demethylubiquinone-9 3-methyltransferase (glyoxalase superfamily)